MKYFLTKDIKPIIQECFSSDKHFIEKCHRQSGNGLDSCINKTVEDLSAPDTSFYLVKTGKVNVGYFVIEKVDKYNVLLAFFIKPEYRKSKDVFWSLIEKATDHSPFLCGVFNINPKAIKFLTDMGGTPAIKTNDGVVFRMGT